MSPTIKSIINNTFLITLTVFVLSGCGGGGGTTAPEITPPIIPPVSVTPTVSISSSQATALVNEQVTLNWKATDGQTCALSGDSTGNVNATDNKTVSFGSIGGKVITITCSGLSKSVTASATINVNAATTYSVPVDISKLTYPDSYQTVTAKTSDINTDPCNLDLSIVTYPQSWIGSYPLPTIKGAPFPANFFGGMNLKDIMLVDNPTFNPNCRGDINTEFDRTINRLVNLNIKYVEIPQWHWIRVNQDGAWFVSRAEDTFTSLPDANLGYFVNAAHKAGLKVIMMNQIQGLHDTITGNAYVPDSNLDNYSKWFAAYKTYLQDRGSYFQSIGVDVWELGCSTCVFSNTGRANGEDWEYFAAQTNSLIPIMRNNFSGALLITMNPWLLSAMDIINSVDYLSFGIYDVGWGRITAANASDYNVQSATTAILSDQLNSNFMSQYDKLGKILVFDTTIQSRASVFIMPGYLEEVVCTSSIGDLNGSATSCLQRETSPDFSIQAIFFEAVFESLKSLNLNSKIIPLPSGYWETNSMISTDLFPNLGSTIRNKPAEGIVKAWFAN